MLYNLYLFSHPRGLWVFSKLRALEYYFTKAFTNVRIFLIPISITVLNPKILGFLFLRKTALLLGVKCETIKLQKIVGNLSSWIENSRQYLLPWTDILQKTVVGRPWLSSKIRVNCPTWFTSNTAFYKNDVYTSGR